MFERFTTGARLIVKTAVEERATLGSRHTGTEHLLLALVKEDGVARTVLHRAGVTEAVVRREIRAQVGNLPLGEKDAAALRAIGIDLDAVRDKVEATFGPGALQPPAPRKKSVFGSSLSPRAKKVLELGLREAIQLHHRSIGPEHILLGLIREGEGLAALILTRAGVSLQSVREQLLAELRAA